jgi:hypothetical protein
MASGKFTAVNYLQQRNARAVIQDPRAHWSVQVARGLGIGLLIATGLVAYGASWLPYV